MGAAGLTNIYAVFTFILILAVLVFFHELGHFGAAKLFKMRVEEFALGFGKRLVRVAFDGQTEYTIRAIPLGGFVRIAGMEIEDAMERRLTGAGDDSRDEDTGRENTNTHLLEQEAAEVDNAVQDGFNSRPLYQRFVVILAGPVFSLLLGWLLLCLVGVVVGLPTGGTATTKIEAVLPGGAAEKAGLRIGDTIVAIDGTPVQTGEAMVGRIHASANKPLELTVRSEKQPQQTRSVTVTPKPGVVGGKDVGLIGIVPVAEGEQIKRLGLAESFRLGNRLTLTFFEQLGLIFKRWQVKENLGGPIRIFQGTQDAVRQGGPTPMLLAAQLSLSLGVFNLFPIPILDGGHLALLTLEGIRGRKLTAEQTQKVLTAGFAIIVLLFVFIMFNDISKLFGRG